MGMTTEHDPDDTPLGPAEAAAAAEYHAPPASVPRDAMWAAIQAQRASRGAVTPPVAPPQFEAPAQPVVQVKPTTRSRLTRLMPRSVMALATAAALAVAIGVMGRAPSLTTDTGDTTVTAAADTARGASQTAAGAGGTGEGQAWTVVSSEHFGMAETMLAALGTSPREQADRQLTAWSRDLLESTRLLMDSPAGRDPKRQLLLQELELVLVQLVESGPAMRTDDTNVMDELLSRSALLLTRIRTTVPAGLPALTP
jgi:hypothetical protein